METSHRLNVTLKRCDENVAREICTQIEALIDSAVKSEECDGGEVSIDVAPFVQETGKPAIMSKMAFSDIIDLESDEL